jgi:hypothetical protein
VKNRTDTGDDNNDRAEEKNAAKVEVASFMTMERLNCLAASKSNSPRIVNAIRREFNSFPRGENALQFQSMKFAK